MKENNEIEKLLLNDENYEKFVNEKIEKEFTKIIEKGKTAGTTITDIKKLPEGVLFTKKTTFLVINKKTKTKTYINGIQAEAYLSGQNFEREKLLKGERDSFVNDNLFIKFYKTKI